MSPILLWMLGCVALRCAVLCCVLFVRFASFSPFSSFFSWRFLFRLFEFLYCVDLMCVYVRTFFFPLLLQLLLYNLWLFHIVLGSSLDQLLEWVSMYVCTWPVTLFVHVVQDFSRIYSHYTALIADVLLHAFFSRANSFTPCFRFASSSV